VVAVSRREVALHHQVEVEVGVVSHQVAASRHQVGVAAVSRREVALHHQVEVGVVSRQVAGVCWDQAAVQQLRRQS
jgi:hypothetical protein